MPEINPPFLDHHETVVTGIYIARGNDTLGPYNSLEAAALIIGGYLRGDDYAARSGDATWVALAGFLPLSAQIRIARSSSAPGFATPTTGTPPHRWRRLATAFGVLLLVPLVAVGGMHWLGRHPDADRASVAPPPPPVPAVETTVPTPAATILPLSQVTPPAPVADGPVNGSLALDLPDGSRSPSAGVRVSAYALAALEPMLAREDAEAQAARARLDPQIEAAATERAARNAEALAALEVLRKADPADPLIRSLRFANTGAKAAAKTAENDYRYLLGERAAAAGGEAYLRGFPEPAAAAETDAQGRFTLPLPPDGEAYAVAAFVRQTADDGTVRLRYWVIKLSPAQRAGHESVRLDDENASFSPAAESLIHTAD